MDNTPLIKRFRIATINTPDYESTVGWYAKWFDYATQQNDKVSDALAYSWAAPAMAGKRFSLMASKGSPDVFLRIVEGDRTPPFNPRTTYGWGSLEFIVDDLDKQFQIMKAGGVKIFREPASLGGIFASIHAMQLFGPMDITHNLTVEKGDRAMSNLPVAKSQVDRPFLIGANGPDLNAMRDFYVKTFNMSKGPDYDYPVPVMAEALNLPKDHLFKLSLVRSAEKGNTIELHDLPKPGGPRPVIPGQLPPGVAMVSFGVKDLNVIAAHFLNSPEAQEGVAYAGKRSVTLKGAAGELIELIEEG
jgi:catechol 2,3-dioxygenase-like lactoylglutathione lyase family enzyme